MCMCQEYEVDRLRKIRVGQSIGHAGVCVTDRWISEYRAITGLNEDACVTEIFPAHAGAVVARWYGRFVVGEQRAQQRFLVMRKIEKVLNLADRGGLVPKPQKHVHELAIERSLPMERVGLVQPRRTEDKGPAVVTYFEHSKALSRGVVKAALVEQSLDEPERRLIAKVVGQLGIALQRERDRF